MLPRPLTDLRGRDRDARGQGMGKDRRDKNRKGRKPGERQGGGA